MANTDNLKDQPTGNDKTRAPEHAEHSEHSSNGLTINDVHPAAKPEKTDAGVAWGAAKGFWNATVGGAASLFTKTSAEELLASKKSLTALVTRPDKAIAKTVETLQHGTGEEKGQIFGTVLGFGVLGGAGTMAAKFAAVKGGALDGALAAKANEALGGMDVSSSPTKGGLFNEPLTGALANKTETIRNMIDSAKPAESLNSAAKEPRISAPVKEVPPAKLGGHAPDGLFGGFQPGRANVALARGEAAGTLQFDIPTVGEPTALPRTGGNLRRLPADGVLEIDPAPSSSRVRSELPPGKPHISDHPTGTVAPAEFQAAHLPPAETPAPVPGQEAAIPTIKTDLPGGSVERIAPPPVEHVSAPPVQHVSAPPVEHVSAPPVEHVSAPPV